MSGVQKSSQEPVGEFTSNARSNSQKKAFFSGAKRKKLHDKRKVREMTEEDEQRLLRCGHEEYPRKENQDQTQREMLNEICPV